MIQICEAQTQVLGMDRLKRFIDDKNVWKRHPIAAVIWFKLTGFVFYRIPGLTGWNMIYVGNLARVEIKVTL